MGISPHHNAAGVEIVVQRLALPQELGGEEDVVDAVLFAHAVGITHGDGGFDDHHGARIDPQHGFDDILYAGGVEEVALVVIVGGRGDHHHLGIAVSGFLVQRGGKV